MVSVCIATYNGEKYISDQLNSILNQLGPNDEVIISDDSSTDRTLEIIESYNDERIKIFPNNKFHSPTFNFENALKQAKGNYIFLSDQDDIWMMDKVEKMIKALEKYYLVVSDCKVVNKDCKVIRESFFLKNPTNGVINNLIRNNYLGCCMAFRKEVLLKAIPFPKHIAMHDIWLGLCAEQFYNMTFIPDKLILYRRHDNNVSSTSEKSKLKFSYKLSYRFYFLYCLFKKTFTK